MTKVVKINDGLQSTVAGLGTMRDKAMSVEYINTEVSEEELVAVYRTSWLARKIVDIPAMDSFREWRSWQAENDQIEMLEEEEERLDLKGKLLRAHKLARLFGECYVYFDLGDDPSQPVDPSRVRKGGIRFVTVLTHRQLAAGQIEQDPLLANFGKPQWYDVSTVSQRGVGRIHPDRVVSFIGNEHPNAGELGGLWATRGDSVLLSLMSPVKQFDSTSANISSLVFEAKIDVIKVKGLMDHIAGNPYEEKKLLDRYRLAAMAKGNNGLLLLDAENEEYEQKSIGFGSLPDIMDRFAMNAAGAADIPSTRLFGRSPAGMNATGEADLRNYYDRVKSSQELEIRPALRVLDECLIYSALGSRPPEAHYRWTSLWQMTDIERTELGKGTVEIIKGMKDVALLPDEVLAEALVNMMTQDGVIPGLEQIYADALMNGAQTPDEIAAEAEEEARQAAVAQATQNAETVVADAAPRTLYISRKVVNAGEILAWAKDQGFESTLPAEDLHVTVAFSRRPVDWMAVGESWDSTEEIAPGGPRLMEEFGEATVLLFSSSSLQYRHDRIKEAGASWDYADYQPHITITYGDAPDDVEPYQGRIVLGPEIFAEVKEDWQSEIEEAFIEDSRKKKRSGGSDNGKFDESKHKRGPDGKFAPKPESQPPAYIQKLLKKDPKTLYKYQKVKLQEYEASLASAKVAPQPVAPAPAPQSVAPAPQPPAYIQKLLKKDPKTLYKYQKEKIKEYEASLASAKVAQPAAPKPQPPAPQPAASSAPQPAASSAPAYIQKLLNKDPKTLYKYQKVKLQEYKASLESAKAKLAPVAPTPTTKDPFSPESQKAFAEIGSQHFGMKKETLTKFATGEWKPDPNKPYQKVAFDKVQNYLKTGKLGTPTSSPASVAPFKGAPSGSIIVGLENSPPPITDKTKPQSAFVRHEDLTDAERTAVRAYTGSSYQEINNALRSKYNAGSLTNAKIASIDSAIAKSAAKTDLVVVRGLSAEGLTQMQETGGAGSLAPGAVIRDLGFVSTTRQAGTAANFSKGVGMKIEVPKGAKILPVKTFSQHAGEDEFVLPRGSSFEIIKLDEANNVLHVRLLAA